MLTDSKNSTKSGRYKEVLGSYDTINDVKEIKEDRVKYWMSVGAKPTETLHNFLIDKKIISGKKINVLPRKSPIKPAPTEALGKEEAVKAEAVAPAAGKEEEPAEAAQAAAPAEAK